MLSKKHNKSILHAKGVMACLTYVDFFSITAQRNALAVTSNCCQNLVPKMFLHFMIIWNILWPFGVDVMIAIFSSVCHFSAKKLAFFSKTNDMIKICKNANIFAKFFGEIIF
jgi:hypothetical protein